MNHSSAAIVAALACSIMAIPAAGQTSISTAGVIESKSGGFKFPDGSVQTTAAADDLSSRVAELEALVAARQAQRLSVIDGVGQEVADVVDFDCDQATYWYQCTPVVALNIEGNTAFFQVEDYGLVDVYGAAFESPTSIYYENGNCGGGLGDSYVSFVPTTGVFAATGVRYAVGGPDETYGTYTLHRAISTTPTQDVTIRSRWREGTCVVWEELIRNLVPAEEISGLEGLLGPSLVEPERTWSVTGGAVTPLP